MRLQGKLLTILADAIAYTLRDTFGADIAAGSVNGTLADSGQARTVTDTNSKLSISGSLLSFATGGSAEANPGMWWPSQARVSGLVLIGEYNVVSGVSVQGIAIGWFTAQSNTGGNAIRPVLGTSLGIRENGTAITVGADLTTATNTYKFAVVLRSTGAWFFIKGGVYTNWTLLYIGANGNTASMFPGVIAVGTTSVGTADNARVPTPLYIPQPLAYDTFTRANGALGSTESVGPDSQAIAAFAWAFTTGIWAVASNVAVGTPSLGSDLAVNGTFTADVSWTKGAGWTISSGTANASAASSDLSATANPLTTHNWYQVVYTLSAFSAGTVLASIGGIALPTHAANSTYTETSKAGSAVFKFTGAGFTGSLDNVTIKQITLADMFSSVSVSTPDVIIDVAITGPTGTSGIQGGIVCNLDSTSSPANFIIAYLTGTGNLKLDECVAGVYTNKINTSVTYSAGAVMRVIRRGTTCLVYYNNALVGTLQTMTANTAQLHGLMSTSALVSFDGFTIWPSGTSGEFEGLSAF